MHYPRVRTGIVLFALGIALGAPSVTAAAEAPDFSVSLSVADEQGRGVSNATVLVFVRWTSKRDFVRHGPMKARVVKTTAAGSANVDIRLTRAQKAAVRFNGDWVNLGYVVLDAAGKPAAFGGTSRYLGSKPDQARQDLGAAQKGSKMRVSSAVMQAPSGSVSASGFTTTATCYAPTYYWDANKYFNGYTEVGQLHVHRDVTKAKFTYGATADSSIDWSSKTPTTPWTISSSAHIGNSQDNAVWANAGGQTNYHWALRTQFQYVNMRLYKDCIGGPYRVWQGSEETGPVKWQGGGMTLANTVSQPARNTNYDQAYGKGTGFSRKTSAFQKVSAAISFFDGPTLGAQSGASQYVMIEYEFGWGYNTHYVYGNNALPSVSGKVYQETP